MLNRMKFTAILIVLMVSALSSLSLSQYQEEFTNVQSGKEFRMSKDVKNQAIHRARGEFGKFQPNYSRKESLNRYNISEYAKSFLEPYSELLKIDTDNLEFIKADTGNGCWYIKFQRTYKGIPVYRSAIGFTVEKDGNVYMIGADYYPDITMSTKAMITDDQAMESALSDFNTDSKSETINHTIPQLVIYPQEKSDCYSYDLAYYIELQSIKTHQQYAYFIDAENGDIIAKESQVRKGNWNIHGTISKQYYPQNPNDTPVNYGTCGVKIFDVGGNLESEFTTNPGGFYIHNWNSAYDVKVLGFGPDMQSSYFSFSDGHDLSVEQAFLPSSLMTYNRYFCTNETNVFYHLCTIHDYFTESPYNYSTMDYLMAIEVHAGSDVNGAVVGDNRIYFGTEDGYQWALYADVVYHEYTHCVIQKLYDGFIRGSLQGYAMDEGFADYYAAALTNDPCLGDGLNFTRNLSNDYRYGFYSDSIHYHNYGQVIGGACWDLRNMGGNYSASQVDYYIFQALMRQPQAHYFADYAENLRMTNPICDFVNMMETAFEDNHNIPVADECISPLPKNSHQNETVSLNLTINSYPNPSNGQVNIVFNNQKAGMINANIYNIMGEKVKDLFESYYDSGSHSLTWDCKDHYGNSIKSGIYFLRVNTDEGCIVKRILVIR
ncbi:MAG: T9SS type A sorting domain-containing protein [Candidatus Delongbacteria bacterium]|nr:T9SS type A sorting domain-containing protein [Candidatus Delongbacteria bacterium]